MKRFFCVLAFIPSLASCVLDDSDIRLVDAYTLQRYAEIKRELLVDVPVEFLETTIEFDAYMTMDPEQRPATSKFFGNYVMQEENVYNLVIYDKPSSNSMTMTVNTGGKSIWDENAVWKATEFSMNGIYLRDVELMMLSAADSTWACSVENVFSSKMTMLPVKDSLFSWVVEAQGRETGDDGMTSEFATSGTFLLREKSIDEFGFKRNFYDGRFNVSIYRDGEPYDYCYMKYNYDQKTDVATSR